ncbi:MAG: tetratricopeptide repeat protein [Magnetococcales bacterium]|nr:tetratricopeptide repeat protein [Magnetococcales bacterium]
MVLKILGEFEPARKHLERGISINKTALEPDHPVVANILDNLGLFYSRWARDVKHAGTAHAPWPSWETNCQPGILTFWTMKEISLPWTRLETHRQTNQNEADNPPARATPDPTRRTKPHCRKKQNRP